MKEVKKVSVVILNWNGASLLREYLPSVIKHSPEEIARVVVADNGSTDDSISMLKSQFPQVKIIALKKNYGFAEGYNKAMHHIHSPYVVLLNSDVEVSENWLEPLIEFADEHPDVAAIQPKIRSLRNRDYFEHAGASGGFIDKYGFPYCRGRIFATLEKDNGQYDEIHEIFWASGAAFFTRTRDYIEAGGLDRNFFAHMEEIDLCWRYKLMNKSVFCVPQSVVYHLGGATLDVENPKKTYLNFRNNLLMLYKNLPDSQRSSLILKRKVLDGIAALTFLIKGNVKNVRSVYKAHIDSSKMIRKHYKGKKSYKKRDVLSETEFGKKFIVKEYYLKRNIFFSKLLFLNTGK